MDIFKFKQFNVSQNRNVHRVGTDGVLLGAWANVECAANILDVGTGTGVIALMMAQRSKAKIIGIEADYEACTIARENIKNNPFQNSVQALHTTLQDFSSDVLFDLVVCNPPFFINSWKPPAASRQQQRHTDSLSPTALIENSLRLLSPIGRLAVVMPVTEGNQFLELATSLNFNVHRAWAVFSKAGKPQERWLLELGKQAIQEPEKNQLCIMDAAGIWTDEYKGLTRDFYLNF